MGLYKPFRLSNKSMEKEIEKFEAGVIHKTLFTITQPIIATAYEDYLNMWFKYIFRFFKMIRIKEIE